MRVGGRTRYVRNFSFFFLYTNYNLTSTHPTTHPPTSPVHPDTKNMSQLTRFWCPRLPSPSSNVSHCHHRPTDSPTLQQTTIMVTVEESGRAYTVRLQFVIFFLQTNYNPPAQRFCVVQHPTPPAEHTKHAHPFLGCLHSNPAISANDSISENHVLCHATRFTSLPLCHRSPIADPSQTHL